MQSPSIVLIGQSPELAEMTWRSAERLRVGRLFTDAESILNDASVSPHHAEVVATRQGWVVRDLGSLYGTFVNDQPVNGQQHPLTDADELRFGRLSLRVHLESAVAGSGDPATTGVGSAPAAAERSTLPIAPSQNVSPGIKTSGGFLRIRATARHSWEEAIDFVKPAGGQGPWQDKHLRALLRAGYSVCKATSPDDLLQTILDDAVSVLDAQRGAIVLADDLTGRPHLRALSLARGTLRNKGTHSQTLVERCFRSGDSLLCSNALTDHSLLAAQSVTYGAMSSIICALLRTPRQRLGVLHLDRGPIQQPFSREEFHLADALAATVSVGIESAQLVERQRRQFAQTVAALGRAVEVRDFYTANHTSRVTAYALLLAQALGLPRQEREDLQVGAPLHDIGKIGIADAILRKPDRLTADEFEHMKLHTVKGAQILETVPSLHAVIPIARNHHERWDGGGYPDGLSGDRIALLARIVAVADAFDAMTSDRPYRKALSLEHAFNELVTHSGSHFDPACAAAFLDQRARVEAICRQQDVNPVDVLHQMLAKL